MAKEMDRNKLELQQELLRNEELRRDLRANDDYRRRAEEELRTIGEEVEKFKMNNEAEYLREIATLKAN